MAASVTVLEAVLLGVVQGLTEWLPVSSSGHLALAQMAFGVEVPVFFDLVLHVGTLAVVLVFFRATVADVAVALWRTPSAVQEAGWRRGLWLDTDRRFAWLVVIGSVPTAVIAFTFEDAFIGAYENPVAVGGFLCFTGALLLASHYAARGVEGKLDAKAAVFIGVAQGLAVAPGVSRSGATVATARLLGIDRELAVRYSFLLGVPAILGATLFQASPEALAGAAGAWPAYVAGTAAAMAVGYASLAWLVRLVRGGKFHWFAPYCFVVGLAAILLGLSGRL